MAWFGTFIASKLGIALLWGILAAGAVGFVAYHDYQVAERAKLAERADRLRDELKGQSDDIARFKTEMEAAKARMAEYETRAQEIEHARAYDAARINALRSTLAKESDRDPKAAAARLAGELNRLLKQRVAPSQPDSAGNR